MKKLATPILLIIGGAMLLSGCTRIVYREVKMPIKCSLPMPTKEKLAFNGTREKNGKATKEYLKWSLEDIGRTAVYIHELEQTLKACKGINN